MRSTLTVLALLVGCPGPEEDGADTDTYTPAPYIDDEEDPPVAEVDVASLEAAIDAATAMVLDLNGSPIFAAYDVVMAGADGDCPNWYSYNGSAYWYDQCTSSDGTSFSGYSFHTVYDGVGADGGVYDGDAFYGVAVVVTPDGATLEAAGTAYDLVVSGDGYVSYSSAISGSFAWDGPGRDGTWLAEDVSPDLSLFAHSTESGDFVQVDGGLSGLGGELDTVVFDAVTLYDTSLGSSCATEPGGVVSVRDVVGNWYDVVFDGPTESGAESDPALCDGCGEAYYRGEPLGEVCADFSSLLAWDGAPW